MNPSHPDCTPTSLAGTLSVCTVGQIGLSERLLTQLASFSSESELMTKVDVPASKHEDFPTRRMQRADCYKFLSEHAWYHPEPCCLIWVVYIYCTRQGFLEALLRGGYSPKKLPTPPQKCSKKKLFKEAHCTLSFHSLQKKNGTNPPPKQNPPGNPARHCHIYAPFCSD